MSKSYNKVNYYLRLNKQIERKIMIELLSKLDLENPISSYSYVGLGSVYFYDHILFHKYLNINKMISIESSECKKRFEYNKPYDFIEIYNGMTTNYLENDLTHCDDDHFFIWLDYDGNVTNSMDTIVEDLTHISREAKEGDIIFLSINTVIPRNKGNYKKTITHLYDKIKMHIPMDKIDVNNPNEVELFTNNINIYLSDTFSSILNNNANTQSNTFHKFASFIYKDGAKMLTFGGIYGNKQQIQPLLNNHYCCCDRKIISIDAPNLTYREKMLLDSKIHELSKWVNKSDFKEQVMTAEKNNDDAKLKDLSIKLSEVTGIEFEELGKIINYIDCYKYYPQYYEGII